MDSHPDSSLLILESVSSTDKFSKEEHALYALLLTKSYYKNHIPLDSDSLIDIAAGYFLQGNDYSNKAYTLYYMGRINQKNKDPQTAWENYRDAAHAAEKTTDNKLIQLIYNHWGILCFEQELYDESLDKYLQSLHYAELMSDSAGMVFILNDIADFYQFNNDYDKTLKYRFQALEIAENQDEQLLLSTAYLGIASVYRQIKEPEKGLHYINKAIEHENDPLYKESLFVQKGQLFLISQDYDSARYYYNKAIDTEDIYLKAALYDDLSKLEENRRNYKESLFYKSQYVLAIDSVKELTRTKDLLELQHVYDVTVLQNENNKLKLEKQKRNNLILWITLISIFIIAISYHYYNREKRKKDKQLIAKDNLVQLAKSQLQSKTIQILQNQNELLEKERELSSYEQERNELKEKILKMNEIIRKIDQVKEMSVVQKIKAKDQIVLSQPELNNLVNAIDAYYDNFTERLIENYEKLTPGDLYICCLLKMGVSSGDIAILLDMSDAALTKRKYRIKKEKMGLKDEDVSLDEFLNIF